MFYICVILLLGIIFLSKLYLNTKLEKENDKLHYDKEIESLKKTNEENLKSIIKQSDDWKFKYYAKCKVIEDEFEKKYAEDAYIKKLNEDYEEIKQWRNNILNIRADDGFLKNLKKYVDDGWGKYHYDLKSEDYAKVISIFKEVETLKQELATQTANNIILKDELNKLKCNNN